MALKQTIRLTIFNKDAYNITGRDGKKYKGFIYEGFDGNNRNHRFTSEKDSFPVFDTGRYQEENARDFILFGRTTLEGGVKWSDFEREKKSLDKDFSVDNIGDF